MTYVDRWTIGDIRGRDTTDRYMQGFQVRLNQEKVSVEHSAI